MDKAAQGSSTWPSRRERIRPRACMPSSSAGRTPRRIWEQTEEFRALTVSSLWWFIPRCAPKASCAHRLGFEETSGSWGCDYSTLIVSSAKQDVIGEVKPGWTWWVTAGVAIPLLLHLSASCLPCCKQASSAMPPCLKASWLRTEISTDWKPK